MKNKESLSGICERCGMFGTRGCRLARLGMSAIITDCPKFTTERVGVAWNVPIAAIFKKRN